MSCRGLQVKTELASECEELQEAEKRRESTLARSNEGPRVLRFAGALSLDGLVRVRLSSGRCAAS